jgi:beta-xylosidase
MAHLSTTSSRLNERMESTSSQTESSWGRVSAPTCQIVSRELTTSRPFVTEGDYNIQFKPGSKMPPQFIYWRAPVTENYIISPEGHPNTLGLKPSKWNLTGVDGNSPGPGGQTFVGRRQVDTLFTYSVDMDYTPKTLNEEAGITLFLTQV